MSKKQTKQSDAESIDIAALTIMDRSDLTPAERHLAEQIYDLSSQLVNLIENGPDPEFADHPSHKEPNK